MNGKRLQNDDVTLWHSIANVVIIFLQNYIIAPLHVAAKYGHVHMVTLLVEKGSKIDIPNKVGTGLLQ